VHGSHLRLAVEEVELGHPSRPSLDPMPDFFISPADAVETQANSRRKLSLALKAPQRGSRQSREAGHVGCSENVHEHPFNCMVVHA
jgi:hypothetical protein